MDFQKIISDIRALDLNLYDFALIYDGKTYYQKFGYCNNCNDSYSIAKAFTMTAIGLLWDEGKLKMSDTFVSIFPEYVTADMDPSWKLVTLEHAMLHRAGFDRQVINLEEEDINDYPSDDFLKLIFSTHLAYLPGSTYYYAEAPFCLLSRTVEKLSGERMDDFLLPRLIRPMKFHEIAWSRDLLGHTVGSTGLYISAVDAAKLGLLYLQDGVYEGQRLLSHNWVKTVLSKEYEFHVMTPKGLIGKGGWLGQGVCFSPEKKFVAAWHGCQAGEATKKIADYLDDLEL